MTLLKRFNSHLVKSTTSFFDTELTITYMVEQLAVSGHFGKEVKHDFYFLRSNKVPALGFTYKHIVVPSLGILA